MIAGSNPRRATEGPSYDRPGRATALTLHRAFRDESDGGDHPPPSRRSRAWPTMQEWCNCITRLYALSGGYPAALAVGSESGSGED